jgi:uncharacterized protein
MTDNFLGMGWAFPFQVDGDGQIRMARYEDDIREAIRVILSTLKGERVMRPEFGCGIHNYVFSVINTATLALIESNVKEALTIWEPRIQLMGVTVSTEDSEEGRLLISIDYKVRTTNNRFNMVYPFYLKEGA